MMPSAAPARTPTRRDPAARQRQTAAARRTHAIKVVRELLRGAAETAASRGDTTLATRLLNALGEVERVAR